jgi:hypothetical protein
MAEASSAQSQARFPTDRRASRSGAASSLGLRRGRRSPAGGMADVPLTRREFQAARLKILVDQAARRLGPSKGAETPGPLRCPGCGRANDHAARFCDQCGRRLPSSPPAAGFAAAVRAAIARDEKASAARLAAREGISQAEALKRVGGQSRTRRRRGRPGL